MQAEVLRTEQINLRLTGEEVARLEKLAAHYAISPQSVLRMLLKRASDELDAQGSALNELRSVAERAPKKKR